MNLGEVNPMIPLTGAMDFSAVRPRLESRLRRVAI